MEAMETGEFEEEGNNTQSRKRKEPDSKVRSHLKHNKFESISEVKFC